jgi:hypothetical protein
MSTDYYAVLLSGVKIKSPPDVVTEVPTRYHSCAEPGTGVYCQTCGSKLLKKNYQKSYEFGEDEKTGETTFKGYTVRYSRGPNFHSAGKDFIYIGEVLANYDVRRDDGPGLIKPLIQDWSELKKELAKEGLEVVESGLFLFTEYW